MPTNSAFQLSQAWKVALFCLLLVPLCAASDWQYEETHTDGREFVCGGCVHVRPSAGDLRIRHSEAMKIRLQYTVKLRRESHIKEAHVAFNVSGNDATVESHAASTGDTQFEVDLEVPATTHLDVHQKVGDLSVDSVEGDKDLSLGVGDIRISTAHSHYRLVNASTASVTSTATATARLTAGWEKRSSTTAMERTNSPRTLGSETSNCKVNNPQLNFAGNGPTDHGRTCS